MDTAATRKRPAPEVTRRKKRSSRPVCKKRGTGHDTTAVDIDLPASTASVQREPLSKREKPATLGFDTSNPMPLRRRFLVTTEQSSFKFKLNQRVSISISGEQGVVRARGDGIDRANQYFVSYMNALGVATESWWNEDQLAAI